MRRVRGIVDAYFGEDTIIFGVNDKITSFAIYYEKDDEHEFRVINPESAVVMKLEK